MADVFLSYRNTAAARPIVKRIAALLQANGVSVWWDYGLEAGKEFEQQILKEIDSARVVVPLWTEDSVHSSWVRREAELGREKLLPARLQQVSPPRAYAEIHSADLFDWDGSIDDAGFQKFLTTILSRLERQSSLTSELREELRGLRALQPLPVPMPAMMQEPASDEVVQWEVSALPVLNDFDRLYATMTWEQHQNQRDPLEFLRELELTVSRLPRLPKSGKRAGLERLLKKHIETEITEGHPIPDSYHLEPVLTDLARKPGIMITCFSDREGFGRLPRGLVIEPEIGDPYAENLKSPSVDR